jgi:hypothetical protein
MHKAICLVLNNKRRYILKERRLLLLEINLIESKNSSGSVDLLTLVCHRGDLLLQTLPLKMRVKISTHTQLQ